MLMRFGRVRAALGGLGWFVLVACAGCGGKLTPVPVSGTVTYKGKPVAGATVTFVRGTGALTNGELALGTTDANGRFELTSHFGPDTSGAGAVAGEYKVTISKLVPPNGMSAAQYQALTDAAAKAGESGTPLPLDKRPPPLVESLPAKYSSQSGTQLTAKVEKGTGEINFPLD
ncbi:MAG TPA: hypothetical protein VGE74_19095 [Gemmata sp.]